MPSLNRVLTTADVDMTTMLPDAVRILDWSRQGRLLAIAANGSALVGSPGCLTAPVTPDPRDAVWLGERELAVVDPVVGLITAGLTRDRPTPFCGARRIGTYGGQMVVAGDGRLGVFGCTEIDPAPEVIQTGIGVTYACIHVGGTIWAVGGTGGLSLIDVALGCIDTRLEIPAVVAIVSRGVAGRLVASDLSGAIHVLELSDIHHGTELTGYCDPVRHLSMAHSGNLVVAAADDEITRWDIADDGLVADEPTSVIAHSAIITALELSAEGFLATGDVEGVVHIWSPLLVACPVATLRLESEVTAIAWSHDGSRLAIGSVSGQLVVADVKAGELA